MKKIDLRDAAEISSNSIAKLGKNEPVRMDILMKLAAALDCTVEDVFETVKDGDDKNVSRESHLTDCKYDKIMVATIYKKL